MSVLRRRDRLVSFRVSEEEYECLRSVSVSQGARSISDFARTTLQNMLVSPMRPEDEFTNKRRAMDDALLSLTHNMGELSRVISEIIQQIEAQPGRQQR